MDADLDSSRPAEFFRMKRKMSNVARFTTDIIEKTTKQVKNDAQDVSMVGKEDIPTEGPKLCGVKSNGLGFIGPKPVKVGNHIQFADHPEFRPLFSPKEILARGSFGGGYFRPITSKITNESYDKVWLELPKDWIENLPPNFYSSPKYQTKVNFYKVKAGVMLDADDIFGLDYWESKFWIKPQDPYGWFQWYCRFYQGRRSNDDERQIMRWINCCGEKGRWKVNLINKCIRYGKKFDDITVSPIIRQTLQHWAYILTEEDFKIGLELYKAKEAKQANQQSNKKSK